MYFPSTNITTAQLTVVTGTLNKGQIIRFIQFQYALEPIDEPLNFQSSVIMFMYCTVYKLYTGFPYNLLWKITEI